MKRFFILGVLVSLGIDVYALPLIGDAEDEYQRATSKGAKTKIELHVVDDEGLPVPNVDVEVVFAMGADFQSGFFKTDDEGLAMVEGVTTGNTVEFFLKKEAYYNSYYKLRYLKYGENRKVEDGKWQPWGKMQLIQLRRIRRPIELIRHEKTMTVPLTNVWMGLDLRIGDWISPYGKGKERDLDVRIQWDGKSPEFSRFCKTEVRFVKLMSGAYVQPKISESEMPFPYEADTNAVYDAEFEYWDRKNGSKLRSALLPDDSHVLRVRCVLSEDGRLLSSYYCGLRCLEASPGMADGKAVLGFECVFNPTPNDTNLEDMDIAQRTYKQIELEKRLEKERREKEAKTVWDGIKKMFGAP